MSAPKSPFFEPKSHPNSQRAIAHA